MVVVVVCIVKFSGVWVTSSVVVITVTLVVVEVAFTLVTEYVVFVVVDV